MSEKYELDSRTYEEEEEREDKMIVAIAAGIGGFFILMILLVTACCISRRVRHLEIASTFFVKLGRFWSKWAVIGI